MWISSSICEMIFYKCSIYTKAIYSLQMIHSKCWQITTKQTVNCVRLDIGFYAHKCQKVNIVCAPLQCHVFRVKTFWFCRQALFLFHSAEILIRNSLTEQVSCARDYAWSFHVNAKSLVNFPCVPLTFE